MTSFIFVLYGLSQLLIALCLLWEKNVLRSPLPKYINVMPLTILTNSYKGICFRHQNILLFKILDIYVFSIAISDSV
jgi:hypothetical protein